MSKRSLYSRPEWYVVHAMEVSHAAFTTMSFDKPSISQLTFILFFRHRSFPFPCARFAFFVFFALFIPPVYYMPPFQRGVSFTFPMLASLCSHFLLFIKALHPPPRPYARFAFLAY
ncbi:unnamed protein product [Laminaria digitata]